MQFILTSGSLSTIIVDPKIQVLEFIAQQISREIPVFSVGKELSSILIGINDSHQSRGASQWVVDELRRKGNDTIMCADIDLLFHPSLKLDPLIIFQQSSRHKKLIVLWPGNFENGILSYGQPEHHHYRFWRNPRGIEIIGASDALQ
jgi:hypothetical protein